MIIPLFEKVIRGITLVGKIGIIIILSLENHIKKEDKVEQEDIEQQKNYQRDFLIFV
ncbi:MAG: hypothetical protein QN732_11145 [Nitrososphaeraceae archaeon]|nr:hypothetical protein [Nitrososphaeraceae archaeon]